MIFSKHCWIGATSDHWMFFAGIGESLDMEISHQDSLGVICQVIVRCWSLTSEPHFAACRHRGSNLKGMAHASTLRA